MIDVRPPIGVHLKVRICATCVVTVVCFMSRRRRFCVDRLTQIHSSAHNRHVMSRHATSCLVMTLLQISTSPEIHADTDSTDKALWQL